MLAEIKMNFPGTDISSNAVFGGLSYFKRKPSEVPVAGIFLSSVKSLSCFLYRIEEADLANTFCRVEGIATAGHFLTRILLAGVEKRRRKAGKDQRETQPHYRKTTNGPK